jgi:hypothetical protein
MKIIFKISSFIYRIILGLVIPLEIVGNLLSAASGHNRSFQTSDYLLFSYIIVTILLLTEYQKLDKLDTTIKKNILLYITTGLVLTSVGIELYSFYDTYFICKCFTTEDNVGSVLTFLFLIITFIVLYRLILDIFKLNRKKIT